MTLRSRSYLLCQMAWISSEVYTQKKEKRCTKSTWA